MSHHAYIRFDGIEGRTTEKELPGWTRLWAFRHSIMQPAAGSAAARGDAGPGRADHGDFIILKNVDEASPRLSLYCCAGARLPNVTVAIHNSANFRLKYIEYKMTDVTIRAVTPYLPEAGDNTDGNGARVVREEIALRYRRITWTYTMLEDGAARGDVTCYWDLMQNQGG
ncbi:MAG: hypothetical protein RLY86_31 [Pseudomonadota bacterium]|jgi:type VI secretion system secreted protein Hcp